MDSFDGQSFSLPAPDSPKPVSVAVGERDGSVAVTFDSAICWLVMKPEDAIKVGELLKEKAIELLRSKEE